MSENQLSEKLSSFYKFIRGRRIAMLGIGVSNVPLIRKFASRGAIVYACDRRTGEELGQAARELESEGIELRLGNGYLDGLNDADIIFRTPGMKFDLPQLAAARERGISVTSEMEVFFDLCPCKMIAVTGSEGKTTTTTILTEMLKKQGYHVHTGGNIGTPLLPDIENIAPEDVAVVELSSFQLISMRRSPDIAVITNITPNHLDMHKDMEEYINAKKNIFIHQNAFSRTVLNLDNDITASFVPETRGQCFVFSRRQPENVKYGSFLRPDGMLCMRTPQGETEVMNADEIRIVGGHNVENYLAAISAAWGVVKPDVMRSVAKKFAGVEHRIEFVRSLDGVSYYNDSIATSPTRTIAGLNSFSQKVILIAGGSDKHIPFDVLGPKVLEKVKLLILNGKTSEKIEEAVRSAPGFDAGSLPIVHAGAFAEAVEIAHEKAKPGDIVILSPASASFDQFRNFEERGESFKNLVNQLK